MRRRGLAQAVERLQQRFEGAGRQRRGGAAGLVVLEGRQSLAGIDLFGLVGEQHGVAVEGDAHFVRVGFCPLGRLRVDACGRKAGFQRGPNIVGVGRQEEVGAQRLQVRIRRTAAREDTAFQRHAMVVGRAEGTHAVQQLQLARHVGAVVTGLEQAILFLEVEEGTGGNGDDELDGRRGHGMRRSGGRRRGVAGSGAGAHLGVGGRYGLICRVVVLVGDSVDGGLDGPLDDHFGNRFSAGGKEAFQEAGQGRHGITGRMAVQVQGRDRTCRMPSGGDKVNLTACCLWLTCRCLEGAMAGCARVRGYHRKQFWPPSHAAHPHTPDAAYPASFPDPSRPAGYP